MNFRDMNILLIAIVLSTLACGAIWHNKSPRTEDGAYPRSDEDPTEPKAKAQADPAQTARTPATGKAGLKN